MILILLALKKNCIFFPFWEYWVVSIPRWYNILYCLYWHCLCFFVIKELFVTSISFHKKKKQTKNKKKKKKKKKKQYLDYA